MEKPSTQTDINQDNEENDDDDDKYESQTRYIVFPKRKFYRSFKWENELIGINNEYVNTHTIYNYTDLQTNITYIIKYGTDKFPIKNIMPPYYGIAHRDVNYLYTDLCKLLLEWEKIGKCKIIEIIDFNNLNDNLQPQFISDNTPSCMDDLN